MRLLRAFALLLLVAVLTPLALQSGVVSAQNEQRTVTILETSDIHGNLMAWDYYTNKPAEWGMTKVASLIKQERAIDPNVLLVDSGDTIQGSPLTYYYNVIDKNAAHPMAAVFNTLKYDAAALGNHEFNYGLDVLNRYASQAQYPVMSANTRKSDGSEAFKPYVIKDVNGVKVGLLALTTPAVPTWEKPANIAGLQFADPVEIAKQYVPQIRAEGANIVVVIQHIGWEKQPADATKPEAWLTDHNTWRDTGSLPGENVSIKLAQEVPGIDAILTGHSHLNVPKALINNVLLTEPSYWGRNLSKVTITVEKNGDSWNVVNKDSTTLSVTNVAEDQEIKALVQPYHDQTLSYISQPVGTASAEFAGGPKARYRDSALADLINNVQKQAAADAGYPVDLSLAAIFTDGGMIPAGQITLRDAYSIYIYDNTLYVMEINGDILRRALERNAEYFRQLDPNALPSDPKAVVNDNARDYNWDLYTDIEYNYDLTKPAGQRVTTLQLNGTDITPEQTLRIAINNYRAGGGGGFAMFREGKIVYQSTSEIRDLIAESVKNAGTIDPTVINKINFTLVPDLYANYFGAASQPTATPVPAQPTATPAPGVPITLPDTSVNQPSYAWVWAAVAMALLMMGLVVRRN